MKTIGAKLEIMCAEILSWTTSFNATDHFVQHRGPLPSTSRATSTPRATSFNTTGHFLQHCGPLRSVPWTTSFNVADHTGGVYLLVGDSGYRIPPHLWDRELQGDAPDCTSMATFLMPLNCRCPRFPQARDHWSMPSSSIWSNCPVASDSTAGPTTKP
jgi:hypothetical protein